MRVLARGMLGLIGWLVTLVFTGAVIAVIAGMLLFQHYSQDLPDYSQLEKYDPAGVTRLYADDGRLLAEYATEKRVFVPLVAIPPRVIRAFLSAEDKNFYAHQGVDFGGILRAVYTNVVNYGQGKSLVGGSTITQQVVKNFLLTDEKSIERKAKEAILAMRISRIYSKDKILELYLNEIYLGLRSYGVAAAALNYFNKSLDDLTIEEAALLAAEPKAPANYDPRRFPQAARDRRDWIIHRMYEDGYITREEEQAALATPITLKTREGDEVARADFFAEDVRRWLSDHYGANVLYEGGLVVKTTLNPSYQEMADRALRKALMDYDRRRGYRGPVVHLPTLSGWQEKLKVMAKEDQHLIDGQQLAVVTGLDERKATIGFVDGKNGYIPFGLMKWTRRVLGDGILGPEVKHPASVLAVGDVVIAAPIADDQKKTLADGEAKNAWDLQQVPAVNGAMVVVDPHNGRVLAMSGGYAFGGTEFNRATQAKRQPGSAFKPFVYLAGLENGYTPTTPILDAPVELTQGAGMPNWQPQNYKAEYLGDVPMRVGLEKSRNTMTVRLAQIIGIEKVREVGRRFGIYDDTPPYFSIVLGSAETTLLRLANAYAMIVNGGKKVESSLIERIDDRHGKTIFRRDTRPCKGCVLGTSEQEIGRATATDMPPLPPDTREQIVDPRIAYQMVSMMEGVVQRGTATKAKILGKPVAGKTGTTNNSMDTWFMGFTPDLVAGVFIGYDKPQTMGKKETGASVALPAFISFMQEALKDKQAMPFRIPPGIQLVRVDPHTGFPALGDMGVPTIQEALVVGAPLFIPESARGAAGPEVGGTMLPWLMPQQEGGQGPEGPAPDSDGIIMMPGNIPQEEMPKGTGGLY